MNKREKRNIRVQILLRKSEKNELELLAEDADMTICAFVRKLIQDRINSDDSDDL